MKFIEENEDVEEKFVNEFDDVETRRKVPQKPKDFIFSLSDVKRFAIDDDK